MGGNASSALYCSTWYETTKPVKQELLHMRPQGNFHICIFKYQKSIKKSP